MFYTEGSLELRDVRLRIAKYTLPRAQLRLDAERKQIADGSFLCEIENIANQIGPYVVQES